MKRTGSRDLRLSVIRASGAIHLSGMWLTEGIRGRLVGKCSATTCLEAAAAAALRWEPG